MKKKITCLIMSLMCLVILGSCGEKAKTEYSIEEFSQIMEDITNECVNEFKDVTDDEREENQEEIGNKRKEIFSKHYKKHGLEVGQEIIISGYYGSFPNPQTFLLMRAEGDVNPESMVAGRFKENIKELPEVNEFIRVKGKLTEEMPFVIDDCELESP